ncbi:MAG TPA: hypothetical protein VJ227_01670 [Patescibacteria group bacterium]|nr:hypothetical protein [Patescibacteria group bacterium]
MPRIETLYCGQFTNRRTEKLRQTREAIDKLINVGCAEIEIFKEALENHEMAHVLGHKPGRTGRIKAHVIVENETVKFCAMEHDIPKSEKPQMKAKEIIYASLAPAFIMDKPVERLSRQDIFSAGFGFLILGFEKMSESFKSLKTIPGRLLKKK